MESSWQVKCGSVLQSSSQSMPSSSSQEPRNQMEMNTGPLIYPHVGRDSGSATHRRMQDPIFPNSLNLSPYRFGHTDLGNSFLALLSGPPSLLQCDFQELSNLKQFGTSGKLPVDSSSVIVSATGNGVPVTSSGLFSENLSKQNLRNGTEICPLVSFRAVASSNCSSDSVLHNGLQPVNPNIQSSDLAKVVFCHTVPGNEKVKNCSSLGGEWHSTSSVNDGKLHRINVQASQKVPLEASSSVSNQPSTFMSGCPRVFCLGTSGDLLLSSTGLLGVVCSCHFLHMSVSKFCEHSGVYDVNPGDAVRMDSGETIAQWRKLYFQKFGIRAPEDQSGWDWREGFSATANLVKSSTIMPSMSKNSNLSHLVGSSGALVRSGQPLDNMVFPKYHHTGQNLVNDAFRNKQKRKGQNSGNFLPKGLIGTSQSNLHILADSQIMDCSMSRCSAMPKFVAGGRDDGCQSVCSYIDSIVKNGNSSLNSTVKNGNSSLTHPKLHNSRIFGKDSDIIRINNAKDGVILDRDAASSNIELRLGQPHQQSRASGNSVLSVVGPQLLDTLVVDPLKSFFPDNTANSRENEESRQYLQRVAGASSSISGRVQNQLNIRNQAFGIHNAINTAKLDNFKGDVAKSSGVSLLTHFNTPPERSVYSEAVNNMVNGSKHIMSKTLHFESHTAKCVPVNVPWNGGNSLERNLEISELGFPRLMDKCKQVGSVVGDSNITNESVFRINKQMENSSSFPGVGGSTDPRFSAVHDKNYYSRQLSSVQPDAKIFNYPEKISCLGNSGHIDHDSLRSVDSPIDCGLVPPSHTVSMGFPLATSTSISYPTSASSKQEGIGVNPYLLDENMRLLAWRQILELSRQQHAISSFGMNQGQGRLSSSSCSKIQQSVVDPSICGEPRQGPNLTSKQDVLEVSLKSAQFGATSRMGADVEKLGPVTGLNNWFDFSTFAQGKSLHPKDIDMQCQLSHDPLPNEQPSLRLGRSENNISQSSGHENCCQRVPYTCFQGICSCAARTKCLEGNYESRVGSSPNALKEQIETVRGEASMLIASKSVKDHIVSKDNTNPLDQSGKLKGQLPKNIICHSSQWRDVPSKVIGACDVASEDRAAHVLGGRGHAEGQLGDTEAKRFNESIEVAVSLKEREISNISSGCSTPAVTQASIEVNKIDSSTVDALDTGYVNNLVVDEGSGIDKCWSSDDALESERSSEFLASTCKTNQRKEGSSKFLYNQSSCSLLEELKLIDSLTWKKGRKQNNTGLAVHGKIHQSQKFERNLKTGKRKRAMKLKMLDASSPTPGPVEQSENPKCTGTAELPSSLSKVMQRHPPCRGTSCRRGACSVEPSSKLKRSTLSSTKLLSRKRNLHRLYNDRGGKDDYRTELNGDTDFCEILEGSGGKKFRRDWMSDSFRQFRRQEPSNANAEESVKYNSVGSGKASYGQHVNVCFRKARPVVFGKYGEISIGNLAGEMTKPAKLVPLSRILKTAKRCTLSKSCKTRLTSMGELKKTSFKRSNVYFDEFSDLKKEVHNGSHIATDCDEMNRETERTCASRDKQFSNELFMVEKERDIKGKKDCSVLDSNANTRLRPKCKEIRKRSLFELTGKGKNFTSESCSVTKISKCASQMKVGKIPKKAEDSKPHERGLCEVSAKISIEGQGCASVLDSDAFCCVCGSSNKDDINCLLECSRCFIIVHQACYGVSKVPRGHWYCRPCRTSSKDIVCVLCGYGGGAMTRALRSRTIVKSLLKAWNLETESRPRNTAPSAEPLQDELNLSHSSGSRFEDDSFPVLRPVNIEPSTTAVWKMDMENQLAIVQCSPVYDSDLKVHNSITAGVIDSTVKQWVHMVCGLWTPRTRCPNVDTMSAFDVSGASCPRANVVCSICNRPGGSCIQCRILNCSVQFHPWCAHQKGLLQSEVEGVDNENVGFYGRCVLHATHPMCESNNDPTETGCQREKELTSARTEGYKGRKRDGFHHNFYGQSNYKGGCLVPQEQLNAWIHINGQKSCTHGHPKPLMTDIEYDCRKEYARYKQTKGWKHLVVYKSGIHALGLYTSRFIPRGEMVVEYVGEIVGLRVSDKRENEYQSGRKLQYKTACYFFRIDKEHIIDATRKGGIARFVNHSCLPNCVAKVISVRNEKKVVFFAERDIFPGEEITYDYHFNHEDEGKKIPCFCNSKNCRRYLN